MMSKISEMYSCLIALIFYKILCKKDKTNEIYIINSTNNLNFNHNSKFFFEFLNDQKDIEVKFVINDKKLKKELIKEYGNYFITNYKLKDIVCILRSKKWVLSTLELPIIEIFKPKWRKVFHLGHGIPLKKIGIAENNISILKLLNRKIRIKNIDYFLSPSAKCDKAILECFGNKIKIFNCGQPRNDILNCKEDKLKKMFNLTNEKTILYAPTWRPYDNTIFFPFENLDIERLKAYLEENDIIIFLRPHPFFKYEINPEIESLSRVKYLDSKVAPEIMEVLSEIDLLITDYSSIFFDYLILDKPILFLPYDQEEYEKEVGFTMAYSELIGENKTLSYEGFEKKVKILLEGNYSHTEILSDIKNSLYDVKVQKNSEMLLDILENYKNINKI